MTVREFPALGFDPAPGDPAALGSAAEAVAGAAAVLGDAAARADGVNSSAWTGDAADAFRDRLAGLPRDLDLAARSHRTAATALGDYGAGLVDRQRRAAELETRAAGLRLQESAAVAEAGRLARPTAPAGSAEAATLRSRYDAARSRTAALGADLQDVLAEARRLHADHRAAADRAARALVRAADAPHDEPGWLSRARSGVKGWIAAHTGTLGGIATVLKGVSAVLGLLSFVPGLQFLAPFAVGAAVAALLLDGARCAAGDGDWRSLAVDAVLTVLPTGPVLRAAHGIPPLARALKRANALIPPTVKGPVFRTAGNLPEGVTATQVTDAARLIRSTASHLGEDVVVQGSRAGWSAHRGSDIDIGIRVDPDRFAELLRQRFGTPNPGSAKERTMLMSVTNGRLHTRESGLRGLRSDLAVVLGRDVDLSIVRRGGPFDNEPWLPLQ